MRDNSPLVLDLESAPLLNVADFLDPPEADKRLTDKAKIAADLEAKKAAQGSKAALDWNCARIVAAGWWTAQQVDIDAVIAAAGDDDEWERHTLQYLWRLIGDRPIVGFCIKTFDLPLLIQRSRYLGVNYPRLDLGKYSRGERVIDLYDILTFNDLRQDFVMRRTAKNFAKRFGIPVDDAVSGADVPALIAKGDYDAVLAHVKSDVRLEVALAERLGVVKTLAPVVQMEQVF